MGWSLSSLSRAQWLLIAFLCLAFLIVINSSAYYGTSLPHGVHSEDFVRRCQTDQVLASPEAQALINDIRNLDAQLKVARQEVAQLEVRSPSTTTDTTPPSTGSTTTTTDPTPTNGSTKDGKPSSEVAKSVKKPTMIIGIPTVSRADVDYLNPTLSHLAANIPQDGSYVVYVMNNNAAGVQHSAFEQARARYAGSVMFKFLVNAHQLTDPTGRVADKGSPNQPGARVRKQTRDLVALMRAAADKSDYYFFLEDDFALCPQFMPVMNRLLVEPEMIAHNWISIKVSYGMNGLLMHNGVDLSRFADYLIAHQARRPPDHLQTEFLAAESPEAKAYVKQRPHFAYRFNMLDHKGVKSSLRGKKMVGFSRCYEELVKPVLFEIDAFKRDLCGHTDLWPCFAKNSAEHTSYPPLATSKRDISNLPPPASWHAWED